MCVLPVPLLPSSRMFSLRSRYSRACQFEDQRLVQRGDGEEVEAVEALYDWELRLTDTALRSAAVAIEQLQFGEPQQIVREVGLLNCAGAGQLVVLAQHGGQPQSLQMMFEQNLRGVGSGCAHSVASSVGGSAAGIDSRLM